MKQFILIFIFILTNQVFSQNFSSAVPLIDMPGDNIDMDVLSPPDLFYYSGEPSHLSWINKNDSIYTVYLVQLAPNMEDFILVKSDSIKKSNTQSAFLDYGHGIRVGWQEKGGSGWRILFRDYFYSDSLGEVNVILDSLSEDPMFTMSSNWISWIENSHLFSRDFDFENSQIHLVDDGICSNPQMVSNNYFYSGQIVLYEKEISGEKQVFLAEQDYDQPDDWELSQLTANGQNINPKLGLMEEISFQNYLNNTWRVMFSFFSRDIIDSIGIIGTNCEHPVCFSYPKVTKNRNDFTPFFVVFDSDSLPANREVFLKELYYSNTDSVINISSSPGDDSSPEIVMLNYADSSEIALIWYKTKDNKTDLWISKATFNPNWGAIGNEKQIARSFQLKQNYPNPFNPTTTIDYFMAKPGHMELSVFDILGKKILTLVRGFKPRGNFKVVFDATGMASGVYYYRLSTDNHSATKKMILIR